MMVARELIPHVAASRRKIIASISSKMGSIGENTSGGYYAYRSSKAALNMAMSCLALDLRDRGITCVTLSPGWVRTDMGGSEAPLSPEQSAQGLMKVLGSVKPSDSGKFFSYDGEPIGW
jgi:NAD(P)-dependent dehydrogenase (short-subunit alcohol dehydrogenase family)